MPVKVNETAVAKMWEQYVDEHKEHPKEILITQDQFDEFHEACIASSRGFQTSVSLHARPVSYYGATLIRDGDTKEPWRWLLKQSGVEVVKPELIKMSTLRDAGNSLFVGEEGFRLFVQNLKYFGVEVLDE